MARTRRKTRPKRSWLLPAGGALGVAALLVVAMWRLPAGRSGDGPMVVADPAIRPAEAWRAGPGERVAFADSAARRAGEVLVGLGVPPKAIKTRRLPGDRSSEMRWEVTSDVPKDIPLTLCNLWMTRMASRLGGRVLDGRQDLTGTTLSLLMGLDGEHTNLVSLRRSPSLARTHGRIALIVDDVGYQDRALIQGFCDLDQKVTLSVFPNEHQTAWAADHAAAGGHGVMIHLPMEPHGYPKVNPGRGAIFAQHSADEVKALTRAALDAVPQATGVNNHMGSRVTEDRKAIGAVLTEVKSAGLFFIDSATSQRSVAYEAGTSMGMRVGRNVQFIDLADDPDAIRRALQDLAWKARELGTAIGIGHAKESTLAVLREALPQLEAEGFTFVTAQEAVR